MSQQQVSKKTSSSHYHKDVVLTVWKREHFYWFEDFSIIDQEVDWVVIAFFVFILIVFLE